MTRFPAHGSLRRFAVPAALALCVALATASVHAAARSDPPQPAADTGMIAGKVVDAEGTPLTGVQLRLFEPAKGALSNKDGRFMLIRVPVGTRALEFSARGYQTVLMPNVQVAADAMTQLTIRLSPVE